MKVKLWLDGSDKIEAVSGTNANIHPMETGSGEGTHLQLEPSDEEVAARKKLDEEREAESKKQEAEQKAKTDQKESDDGSDDSESSEDYSDETEDESSEETDDSDEGSDDEGEDEGGEEGSDEESDGEDEAEEDDVDGEEEEATASVDFTGHIKQSVLKAKERTISASYTIDASDLNDDNINIDASDLGKRINR